MNTTATDFWQAYLNTLPETPPHKFHPLPEAWSFGDSDEMAYELGELVRQGIKTATCHRYLGDNVLEDGGLSIILGAREKPLCLVDTFEVTVKAYKEVDVDFAYQEGEGDRTLEYWRKEHWNFFSREAEREGYEVSEDMLLACERFRVLYADNNL